MPKIIQICMPTGYIGLRDPKFGEVTLIGLCADGTVWRLFQNTRGEIWVPLKAVTYSSVAAVKQTASGDQ